jgi:co-chaperonin GroES (HSP10)
MIQNGQILATKILAKEIIKTEKLSKGGIIVPSNAGKDPNISAIVTLVGTGTPQIEMCVQVGQTILFNPHSFQRVRIAEDDFLLLDVRDVLFYYWQEQSVHI